MCHPRLDFLPRQPGLFGTKSFVFEVSCLLSSFPSSRGSRKWLKTGNLSLKVVQNKGLAAICTRFGAVLFSTVGRAGLPWSSEFSC
jgi:hypothetical protein